MSRIIISEEGYKEFMNFLDSCNLRCNNLRIGYPRRKSSNHILNINIGEMNQNDVVEKVNDISFIMTSDLLKEYGGFIILSSNENNGNGLTVKPINM
jgi:iron-sulfur cluster insertion protein